MSATHAAHSDQANQGAVWRSQPTDASTLLSCPSVTTPLYSTTVCQALRGEGYEAITPVLPFSSVVGRDATTQTHAQAAWSPLPHPPSRY